MTLLSLSAVKRTWYDFFLLSESSAAHLAYSNPTAAPAAFNHWNYQIKRSGNGLHKGTVFGEEMRLFLRRSCMRWRSERDKNISIVMPLQNMPHAARKMWITAVIRIRLRKTAKEKKSRARCYPVVVTNWVGFLYFYTGCASHLLLALLNIKDITCAFWSITQEWSAESCFVLFSLTLSDWCPLR